MLRKKEIKELHKDDLRSVKKGVRYATKGRQTKIYNPEGRCVLVIGKGKRQFEDDELIETDTQTQSKKSS